MDFLKVKRLKLNNELHVTITSEEQNTVESAVEAIFRLYIEKTQLSPDAPALHSTEHVNFLRNCLTHLPSTYICLDASRPWMCYWICHSLNLMNHLLDEKLKSQIITFLEKCQNCDGGFGGGPGQAAHLASTYAAVNALCSLNTNDALRVIRRDKLLEFLWTVKCKSGAFSLEVGGEVDIRGAYCAAAVASITNLKTDDLFNNTAEWIMACQTYEGGFSGCPGMEAHGGYTFCGVSALTLLNAMHLCDIKSLVRWCINKQTTFEGGFQGRTNKLVDGCYSFWQGAVFPVVYTIMSKPGEESRNFKHLFSHRALQEYILICCQHPAGGLLDKPGKPRDIYHSCYTLSGLSISQYLPDRSIDVVGRKKNLLVPVHPLYNLSQNCAERALNYYYSRS